MLDHNFKWRQIKAANIDLDEGEAGGEDGFVTVSKRVRLAALAFNKPDVLQRFVAFAYATRPLDRFMMMVFAGEGASRYRCACGAELRLSEAHERIVDIHNLAAEAPTANPPEHAPCRSTPSLVRVLVKGNVFKQVRSHLQTWLLAHHQH